MAALLGRRPQRLAAYIGLVVITFFLFSRFTPVPAPVAEKIDQIENAASGLTIPHFWQGSHKTPEPTNGTASTSSWYEHWNWLSPFGSSKDYHESRTVLPPLPKRCPIYAYYDKDIKASTETKADNEIMHAWRMAWWASGFKPIILGPEDAKQHGMYSKVMGEKRTPNLQYNLLRWLAWDRMGAGILSDFRIFPMAKPSDPMLTYLRRCDFGDKITRFETLGNAFYAGPAMPITAVVNSIANWKKIPEDVTSPADMAVDYFTLDMKPKSIAYYSTKAVSAKYEGLAASDLPRLINAHLHSFFQAQYSDGINVINPLHPNADLLSMKAMELAHKLAQCPDSPLPKSCPPHLENCKLCDANTRITTTKTFQNSSTVFTLGGIPHPYTLEAMVSEKEVPSFANIRRNSSRDTFIRTITGDIIPTGPGALYRVVRMKEFVAAPIESANTLWAPTEKGWEVPELEWTFGFHLPSQLTQPPPPIHQDEKTQKLQQTILKTSETAITATAKGLTKLRQAVEAWNLADFEIWKFASAYQARRKSEREIWENQEKGFKKGIKQ